MLSRHVSVLQISDMPGEENIIAEDASPLADFSIEGPELDATRIHDTSYEWGDVRVQEYFSKYKWTSMLKSLAASVDILDEGVLDGVVSLCKVSSRRHPYRIGKHNEPRTMGVQAVFPFHLEYCENFRLPLILVHRDIFSPCRFPSYA
ncbi:hypothetical protein VNO80_01323 [Phaseolus coccineus]|uniref:Uncharacterized protein n=1 Tax=Phaseolus coccineus TaxID=3886 RepID=A0AAN9WWG4_PHACN